MEKSHGNVQPIGVATAAYLAGMLSGFYSQALLSRICAYPTPKVPSGASAKSKFLFLSLFLNKSI